MCFLFFATNSHTAKQRTQLDWFLENEPEMVWDYIKGISLRRMWVPNSSNKKIELLAGRWVRPATISFSNIPEDAIKICGEAIRELNNGLLGTGMYFTRIEDFDKADIKVYFGTVEELTIVLSDWTGKYERWGGTTSGLALTRSNNKGEIVGGVTLISTESLRSTQRKQTLKGLLLHEISHVLGLSHSTVFDEALMHDQYEHGDIAVEISVIDRKFFQFFYRHVEPGWNEDQLRAGFDKYWNKTEASSITASSQNQVEAESAAKFKMSERDARIEKVVFEAEQLISTGSHDDAIILLKDSLLAYPSEAAIYRSLGNAYLGKGNEDKGMEAFKKAFELNPDDKKLGQWLGNR